MVKSKYKKYNANTLVDARPYELGEKLSGVKVEHNYEPKLGDMVGRDPYHHNHKWLIYAEDFKENFQSLGPAEEVKKGTDEELSDIEKLKNYYK